MKRLLLKMITLGERSDLSEGKKLAIQIAILDAYLSLAIVSFYIISSLGHHQSFFTWMYTVTSLLIVGAIFLLFRGFYDTGRFLIHGMGLVQIFLSVDSFGTHSGAEIFYFTTIAIPFATFAIEEQWKGNVQTILASILLISQQIMGTGIFLPHMAIDDIDQLVGIIFIVAYSLVIFNVLRWQVKEAQKVVAKQQADLLHSSNMIARGELTGIIAHEINNPLQSLSLRIAILRDKLRENHLSPDILQENLNKMEKSVINIGKLIQGLTDVVEAEAQTTVETFHFGKVLEDVLAYSTDTLNNQETKLFINGDSSYQLKGHSPQIHQVLQSLINHSLEALKGQSDKWIRIKIVEKNSFLQVCVTDSRRDTIQGTTMVTDKFHLPEDLALSRKIIEKNHGRLFHDPTDPHTRMVILLPLK